MHKLIDCGVLDCFVHLLSNEDSKSVKLSLEGMTNILNKDPSGNSDANPLKGELASRGAFEVIAELEGHDDEEVCKKAKILLGRDAHDSNPDYNSDSRTLDD